MTGSHAASTRGSAAARAATSGPMPAGSPQVIATRGFILLSSATAASATSRTAIAGSATGGIVAAAFTAAAAVLNTLCVRQLVAEAAFQPPAQAGELRGVEAQLLLLCHLD